MSQREDSPRKVVHKLLKQSNFTNTSGKPPHFTKILVELNPENNNTVETVSLSGINPPNFNMTRFQGQNGSKEWILH